MESIQRDVSSHPQSAPDEGLVDVAQIDLESEHRVDVLALSCVYQGGNMLLFLFLTGIP